MTSDLHFSASQFLGKAAAHLCFLFWVLFFADFQLRERNGQSLDVTVLEHRPSGLGVCIFLITCFIAVACTLVKKIRAMFLSLDLYCITIKIKNVRVSSNSNKPKD